MTGLWLVSYVTLWLLFVVVAIVLLSVLRNFGVIYDSITNFSRPHRAPTKLVPGETLPRLTLQTLSGHDVSLSEFHRGKTAFSIVSPHCGPCRGFLKRIAENGTDPDPLDPTVQHRVIVSIGDISGTAELIREAGLCRDLPVLIDTEARVSKEWGITGTPTTVIVDDHLKVVRHIFGSSPQEAAPTAGI